jgi:hypothetical protein
LKILAFGSDNTLVCGYLEPLFSPEIPREGRP